MHTQAQKRLFGNQKLNVRKNIFEESKSDQHFALGKREIVVLLNMITQQKELALETTTQFELADITKDVQQFLSKTKIQSGLVCVFAPHTTAAIRINHSEPLLKQDIMKMLYRIAPIDITYAHDFFEVRSNVKPDERSNGHAHVKAFLLGESETIPVAGGKLVLGERQSVFFVELDGGRKRRVIIQVFGE